MCPKHGKMALYQYSVRTDARVNPWKRGAPEAPVVPLRTPRQRATAA